MHKALPGAACACPSLSDPQVIQSYDIHRVSMLIPAYTGCPAT